jgi:hypothetical protein
MKIAHWGLGILLVLPAGVVAAQQQSTQQAPVDPVVEAARHAREQKKDEAKAPHVWTNDDVPKTNGVSVVGETPADAATDDSANPPAAPAGAGKGDANVAGADKGTGAESTAALAADLAAAKEQLKSAQTDLDILQRKYALDQQTYLSNPDHDNDAAAASALKDEEDQIAEKKQAVADAQKKVDDLQAKLAAPPPAPRDDKG